MRWFQKDTPKDPWDEEVAGPLSDLAAAKKIRTICNAAVSGAQQMNGRADKRAAQRKDQGTKRYVRAAQMAMELAMKISNDPVRDVALRQIIQLCMTLDNLQTAQILARAIRADAIRAELFKEYPALRQ